jgi:hypothetical protein
MFRPQNSASHMLSMRLRRQIQVLQGRNYDLGRQLTRTKNEFDALKRKQNLPRKEGPVAEETEMTALDEIYVNSTRYCSEELKRQRRWSPGTIR